MTTQSSALSLHFHGTGSGGNLALGCAAVTLEQGHQPILLVDCGPGTVGLFQQRYQQLPPAIFMTHCHMDHIADLEILTVRARLAGVPPIPLFVPLNIISTLHQRLATYPGSMAEGGHNFWQSFQLIPVTDCFEWQGHSFRLYPARHHAPHSAFSLHLPGAFFYSGDTRPIPEVLAHCLTGDEIIFHDCGRTPNPSHTGLDDLAREYSAELCQRLVLYHYASDADGDAMRAAGFRVARPQDSFVIRSGA